MVTLTNMHQKLAPALQPAYTEVGQFIRNALLWVPIEKAIKIQHTNQRGHGVQQNTSSRVLSYHVTQEHRKCCSYSSSQRVLQRSHVLLYSATRSLSSGVCWFITAGLNSDSWYQVFRVVTNTLKSWAKNICGCICENFKIMEDSSMSSFWALQEVDWKAEGLFFYRKFAARRITAKQ